MKFTSFGAARQVTGSRHLLEIADQKILLDCGMRQGHRKDANQHNRELPFDANQIKTVILSHAHIDHCGTLPILVKNGFNGVIYTTQATRDITELMLLDSAHIAEADALFWRKKHPHELPIDPLFNKEDVKKTMSLFQGIDYNKPTKILPNITLIFYDAGHVLGSAISVLDFVENNLKKRLVFTGDLGRDGMPILKNPEKIDSTDFLITESTYGNRLHDNYQNIDEKLMKIINHTAARGGKIIIPSFALERAQEIIYTLHLLHDQKKIPEILIFIDSPLTFNLTQIFANHMECFDEAMKKLWEKHTGNPFGFGQLKYTHTVEESMQIDDLPMPAIIISASGMCEAGRILHHLKATVEDQRNTILFVGYQAEGTLGRKLQSGEKQAKIFGEMYHVRAEIASINAFSAHADYQELLGWLKKMKIDKKIWVVHGEEKQALSLAEKLQQAKPDVIVEIPKEGEEYYE